MSAKGLPATARRHGLLLAFGGVTALIVLLAALGGVRAYTAVPFWDMWDAMRFYYWLQEGDIGVWWRHHNEHRIILSRGLFWLDFTLFKGVGAFLIVINYVLAALAVLLFVCIGRDRWRQASPLPVADRDREARAILGLLLCAWLFQWMQWENFTWAFQSQFFLAQLVPLAALYAMARSTQARLAAANNDSATDSTRWFVAACLLGVVAAGTMANGIITLPLLAVFALLVREPLIRVTILVALAVLVPLWYFSDFQTPEQHGSLSGALVNQPIELVQYILFYLGNPFYHLIGVGRAAAVSAMLATSVMAIATLSLLAIYVRRGAQNHALGLALVLYIAYIAGTALGTAGGRLVFGVEQALANRYTTPALMAWAALFMLMLPAVQRLFGERRYVALTVSGACLAVLFYAQTQAIHQRYHMQHDRKLAGLALELGVYDARQITTVHPVPDQLLQEAAVASAIDLGMFGVFPWADRREQMGEVFLPTSLPTCLGYLDSVTPIATDPEYYLIEGWLVDRETRRVPELITVVNTASEIAGFALGGWPREDVREAVGRYARISG